jgi:hypothetical protein
MKNFSLFISITLILIGCKSKVSNKDIASNYLIEKGYVADHTIDNELTEVINGINILTKQYLNKTFVTEANYNPTDTNQILVTPFRKKIGVGTVSAFSSIENRLVFICPLQIKDFVSANSLSDTADIKGYLGIILLHELGHFSMGISGSFDENSAENTVQNSQLGEQDMGTEPELMTIQKRLELKVDSLAVELVKKGVKITDANCFNACMNIQLTISGAEFMLFGKRLLENFGSTTPKLIRDKNWTHPNLELRLAFMNYYLNPTLEKQSQIDNYLYQREVEPIRRQETDPRIYQGERKVIQ